MIEITNICPVCMSKSIYEFEEEDSQGDDFPKDATWGVPCSSCEDRMAKALNADDDLEGNRNFLDLHEGCLHGSDEHIAAARQLIL